MLITYVLEKNFFAQTNELAVIDVNEYIKLIFRQTKLYNICTY